jgi:chromosome segregation ATPase
MDLVQFRWLQIRAFESLQATEQENIELRKQISQLQTMVKENSGSHKQALYTFAKFLVDWLQRERQQLQSMKILFYSENEKNKVVLTNVSSAMKKLNDRIKAVSDENSKLKKENRELRGDIDRSRSDGSNTVALKLQEIERLKGKIAKLQEELGGLDSLKANYAQTIEGLKADAEQAHCDKSLANSKYEVCALVCLVVALIVT